MWQQKTGSAVRNLLKRLENSVVGKLLLRISPIRQIALSVKNRVSTGKPEFNTILSDNDRLQRQKIKNGFSHSSLAGIPSYAELFVRHDGYISSKWGHYCFVYQELFARFLAEKRPITLLEIGVQNGGSLQLWQKFLPEGSQIYGIDVDPLCRKLEFAENIQVFTGNANSQDFWKSNLQDVTFDAIIDDGSHLCDEVTATFDLLFDKKLNLGGIYLVEDLHTSYSWAYNGGFRERGSSVEYFKGLIDAINANHYEKPLFLSSARHKRMLELNRQIKKVTFYDSICSIEKYSARTENAFEIFLTGFEAGVYIDNKFEARKIENNLDKIDKIKKSFG